MVRCVVHIRTTRSLIRRGSWKSIIKVLAALHKLDPKEIGLGDYASTKPFYARQIKCVSPFPPRFATDATRRSLGRVSVAQSEVPDQTTGVKVGPIPGIDFLLQWYNSNLPSGGKWDGGIVHGDFKCDNMVRLVVSSSCRNIDDGW